MAATRTPKPTEAELAILRVLWQRPPSTVREIYEAMPPRKPSVGYTTILKILQIMTAKGLVLRDEARRSHVYRAAIAEQSTQKQLVGDLLARAFGGSARKLVMAALSVKKTSPVELDEIRKLLDQMEAES